MVEKQVFVLQHTNSIDDEEDVKFIGVYSSHRRAELAIIRTVKLEGFRDCPGGFTIDSYEVDVDHWNTGFVIVDI